jgi:hypothetical protein
VNYFTLITKVSVERQSGKARAQEYFSKTELVKRATLRFSDNNSTSRPTKSTAMASPSLSCPMPPPPKKDATSKSSNLPSTLPAPWQVFYDEEAQNNYYHNTDTDVTTWIKPRITTATHRESDTTISSTTTLEEIKNLVAQSDFFDFTDDDVRRWIAALKLATSKQSEPREQRKLIAVSTCKALDLLSLPCQCNSVIRKFASSAKSTSTSSSSENCHICERLSSNNTKKRSIDNTMCEAGAIELVLTLLNQYASSSADVAEKGCEVLRNMCWTVDIEKHAVALGAIPLVLGILHQYGNNLQVVLSACHALAKLCYSKSHLLELVREDGLRLLLCFLEKYTHLLSEIASGRSSNNKRVVVEEDEENGESKITGKDEENDSEKENKEDLIDDHIALLLCCLIMLEEIQNSSNDMASVMKMENWKAIRHNCNMLLYKQMILRPDNILVCSAGSQAIHSLCHDVNHRTVLINEGVIDMCIAAINKHGTNSFEITEECIGAIAQISSAKEDDFEVRIARQGGISILLNALKNNFCADEEYIKNHENITRFACLALRNIVPNDKQSAIECLQSGGVEILLHVIRVYGERNYRVAKRGCRVLRALCCQGEDEKGKRAIIAKGGRAVIEMVKASWEKTNQSAVAGEAGKLLSWLC